MIRRVIAVMVTAAAMLAVSTPAIAAPTTEVVEGRTLRIVSVADWQAAGSMGVGDTVQWDLAVSANAPEPGTVTLGLSATGSARLLVDVELCLQEWQGSNCDGGAVAVRSGWEIPRDGDVVDLVEIADTDTAHLRLLFELAPDDPGGSTSIHVHASGRGEDVSIGSDGGLAQTGSSSVVPLAFGGVVLVLLGLLLSVRSVRSIVASTQSEGRT